MFIIPVLLRHINNFSTRKVLKQCADSLIRLWNHVLAVYFLKNVCGGGGTCDPSLSVLNDPRKQPPNIPFISISPKGLDDSFSSGCGAIVEVLHL